MTKAEFFKLKNIKSLHLLYLYPLSISVIALIIFIHDMDGNIIPANANPNFVLFKRFYLSFYTFLSPVILTLIYYAILQVEFKNKAWENLYILTGAKYRIYTSKMLVGIVVTTVYVVASFLFVLLVQLVIRMLFHNYFEFEKYSLFDELMLYPGYLVTYWMLCIIVFNFLFYVENAILSVGGMTFLLIFSSLILKPKWTIYLPFTYPFRVAGTYKNTEVSDVFFLYSAILIPIVFFAGLYFFTSFYEVKK